MTGITEYVDYILASVPKVPFSRRFSRLASKCRILGEHASSYECDERRMTFQIHKLLCHAGEMCKDWVHSRDIVRALVRIPREMSDLEKEIDAVYHENRLPPQPQSAESIEQDEQQDWEIMMKKSLCLMSRQRFQDDCLALELSEAEDMIKVMQRILIQSTPDNPDRAYACKILYSLSEQCSMFVTVRNIKLDKEELPVASGCFGSMSKATHNGNNVAVKTIRLFPAQYPSEAERMLRRQIVLWTVITQKHHPHILPLIGIADSKFPLIKIVTPWQKHGSLSNYVRQPSADKINRLRLLTQVCSALQFLHSHVPIMIHGALKCANVLVNQDGMPYLADFGLATVRNIATIEHGDARWMAPELFKSDANHSDDVSTLNSKFTCFSDIWSFAMLALELLSDEFPFPDKTTAAVIDALREGERPKQPRSSLVIGRGLNHELWQYLEDCWEPLPANRLRLQSLHDVLDTLATQWRYPTGQIRKPQITFDIAPLAPNSKSELTRAEILDRLHSRTNTSTPVAGKNGDNHAVKVPGAVQDIELKKDGDEHLKQKETERIREVKGELTVAENEVEKIQIKETDINLANIELQDFKPDVSHQTSPIAWIHCNREHVTNIAQNLLRCKISVSNIYPRLTMHTLVCILSMNASQETKQAKLLDLITVLETWKVWDDISMLANHKTIKDWLLACLKSINTMHQIRYHDPEIVPTDLARILDIDAMSIDALLLATLQDRIKRKQLVKRSGQEAQSLLNLLQARLGFPLDPHLERFHLWALIRLCRSSGLYPECMILKGIEKAGTAAVDFGGYGDIWKGSLGGNEIGIKVLRILRTSEKEKFLKYFSSEAVIWRQLRHPNVLPFYGVYHLEDERLCLASPWMNNGNVVRFLEFAPQTECVPLMLDIAEGLNYLHTFTISIIHGDIKGVNILITQSGRACLADFGLAAAKCTESMAVTTAVITRAAGTLRWQAPELMKDDDARNSRASDIYAYACVCYELFSGKLPFHNISKDSGIMCAVLKGKRPPRPSDDRSRIRGLNNEIWNIIETCWAKKPGRRLSAEQIVERLNSSLTCIDRSARDNFHPTCPSRTLYLHAEHPFATFAGTMAH
ncbi:hypothetical protein PILCRDRAFT_823402 [Piloderma croceum F 1598]|uniref:Protein kinase domain-containing protein n=1 Tax=Piloderma croceum (strain F 1598) TaxID=765440 RepID=A0A0C3FIA1_PILCF|nr:hypothetical protein PILCRDRAFT_823402 [Piloderma croceum F 1598]